MELLDLAPSVPIRTEVEVFALGDAEHALDRLRAGEISGAAVLTVGTTGQTTGHSNPPDAARPVGLRHALWSRFACSSICSSRV